MKRKREKPSIDETARRLSAVILAGGKSSRFGRDKSTLELEGKSVLAGLVETLRAFPFRRLVWVRAPGKGAAAPEGVEALEDEREGMGPMGGILTALHCLSGGVLVAACDMPLVSRGFLRWLLGQYDPGAEAVVPRHGGGIEPLLGIYAQSIVPRMEAAVETDRFALHLLLEQAATRFVEVPDEFSPAREFANINTPEDYKRILKMAEKKNKGNK
ncbi:MAG TPA: molybdenum cofactor guanylyltransferase [Candidatus Binatia bacterium]